MANSAAVVRSASASSEDDRSVGPTEQNWGRCVPGLWLRNRTEWLTVRAFAPYKCLLAWSWKS